MKFFFIFLLTGILMSSCKKFLDIPFPQGQVSSGTIFSDDSTASAAVNGLYGQLMPGPAIFLNGSLSVYPGLSADELFNTASNTTSDQFFNNALAATENSQIYNGLWRYGFIYVFHCNAIIEGLNVTTSVSKELKDQLMGETLAIRALTYFYLTNLFGEVPLQLSTNYEINGRMPRTKTDLVYEQIISDLNNAINLLPITYPKPDRTRFNRFAAAALLSRVYLYNQNYQRAEEVSSLIIDQNAVYKLGDDLSKLFLPGSQETILGLYPASTSMVTGDGAALIPPPGASVRPPFALAQGLFDSFEQGDKRKTEWVRSKTVGGILFYYPFKYRVKTSTVLIESNVIFRLAEQLLIRAEARAMQNKLPASLEDLNAVRKRSGLPVLTFSTKEEIMNALIKERRIEFLAEKGHRWFDLKRWGLADAILGMSKPGWSSTDALYPIPQSDIDRNPFLTQNPEY